jgi:hypothetical protein
MIGTIENNDGELALYVSETPAYLRNMRGAGPVVCPECDDLWRRYEAIVFAQSAASNRLLIVGFCYDPAGHRGLSAEVSALIGRRSDMQVTIRNHSREAHSKEFSFGLQ